MAQTVVIEGEPYWDGGYMGNPAIYPLIYHCESRDVMIVHINPIVRDGIPKTAGEIMNRLNELSFNSSLMREMRAIHFVTSLVDTHEVSGRPLKRMILHAVAAEKEMSSFSVASKLNADWDFLTKLHDIGRRTADAWLAANFDKIGQESSVDIKTAYL
jgi:NTE family protein